MLGGVDPATVTALFEARRLLLTEAARLAAERRSNSRRLSSPSWRAWSPERPTILAALLADWSYMGDRRRGGGKPRLSADHELGMGELYLPRIELFAPVVADRRALAPLYTGWGDGDLRR